MLNRRYLASMALFVLTLSFVFMTIGTALPQDRTGSSEITAIRAGKLIDGIGDSAADNVIILITGDRITDVGTDVRIPSNATVIDLSGYTVLPGLIDTHSHILLTPENPAGSPVLYKSIPYRTVEGVLAVKLNLEAGFTTLRDIDSEGANFADVGIRDAINDGLIPGPRLQVATMALSITGGHMNVTGLAPHIEVPQLATIADTPYEQIKEIRRQIKYGADWIKLYATGTLRHINRETFEPLNQVTLEEVKMIVAEAKRWNIPVSAHAYGGEGATNAILGGVRSLEHGFALTDEQLQMMVDNGTYWSPTLTVYLPSNPREENDPFTRRIVESHKDTFGRALKMGVKIAFGTDVGGFEHGKGAQEFKLMVDYGMTPMQAIKSATMTAAELMRLEKSIGSIETGKYADIIAVRGNPLDDITILENVAFVMKGGMVYKK